MAKTAINFSLVEEVAPRNFNTFISIADENFKYHVWDRGIIPSWHIAVPAQRVFPHRIEIAGKACKVASVIVGVYDPNWGLKAIDTMSIALLTAYTYGPRKEFPDTIGAKESSKKGLYVPVEAENIPVVDGGILPLKRVASPAKDLVDLAVSEICYFKAGAYKAFAVAAKAKYGSGQIYGLTPEGDIKIGTKRYQVFTREFRDTAPEGLDKIQVVPIPGTTPAPAPTGGNDELPF